ncbi:unnamed protein product, partial [marine sediment metagenome]
VMTSPSGSQGKGKGELEERLGLERPGVIATTEMNGGLAF